MKRLSIISCAILFLGILVFSSCQKEDAFSTKDSPVMESSDINNQGLFRSEMEYVDIFIPPELLGNIDLPAVTLEEEGSYFDEETGETYTGAVTASFVQDDGGGMFTSFQVSGGLIDVVGGQSQDLFLKWYDLFLDCAITNDCASYADPILQAQCYFGCAVDSLFDCLADGSCSLM